MEPRLQSAYQALQQAQTARKQGQKSLARHYAEQALQLAPELEEPWLMMAALASPRASVGYLEKALEINPSSERARQGMAWAVKRLREQPRPDQPTRSQPTVSETQPTPKPTPPPAPPVQAQPAAPIPQPERSTSKKTRRFLYPALLLVFLCAVLLVAAGLGGATPALAFIHADDASTPTEVVAWSQVDVAKPSYTPTFTPTYTPTNTPTSTPTFTPSPTPTETSTPTLTPTETPTPTDTPTPAPTRTPAPTPTKPKVSVSQGTRWIDIDLTNQMLYAYEGDVVVASFLISSGTWLTPTVVGQYNIWHKTPIQDMSGPGYYLPDVQWVMYFYKDYGIHGTYWHNNFGTPMSHGCINMRNGDAEWLYYWASYGTLVNVHY